MAELKVCPVCSQAQPLDQYYERRSRARKDGQPAYQHGCKTCRKRLTVEWQAAHPERTRQLARKASLNYYAKHKTRIRATAKARHAADPEAQRAKWRARYAARKAARRAEREAQGIV